MPRSAIATGMVDRVLPIKDTPGRLLAYFRLEHSVELPPDDRPDDRTPGHQADEALLRDILSLLRTRTGRDFHQYKRATVLRRIILMLMRSDAGEAIGLVKILRDKSEQLPAPDS